MKLTNIPFQTTDWSQVPAEEHPGDVGIATWRVKQHGDVRVRMVEYSPGYVADHWCEKGHILLCVEGELHTRLKDGCVVVLRPGMSYEVSDGDAAHRSEAPRGARLFIVD
ncbi:MAG: DHCW motif cupin fold protein [Gemmatimonadetes bacterium]|nr:DHCW motif cupin fold protein [Gemmatimonadota bacterium]